MSELKIYTRNYIDRDCDLIVSSGDDVAYKLYDRDKNSQWSSDSEDSDATESTIQVDFKQSGQVQTREIDRIILLNHNLEDPIAEYWDGSAWQTFDSETNLTDGQYTLFTHAAVETQKIRVRNSQTITPDQEKAVGEIIACAVLFSPTEEYKELASLDVSLDQRNASENILADGSIRRVVVMHSANRSDKYEARGRMDYLNTDDIEALQAIKQAGRLITWHPESTTRPDEIYQVYWIGPFRPMFVSSYKTAGYRVEFNVKES